VVISDKRSSVCVSGNIDHYEADIIQATDYYCFGSPMTGRVYQASGTGKYRFGFNDQERDDEVSGAGNTNSAEYWEYDTRLGRRWNVDPVTKPWQSNYSCFSDNPIWKIDPNGDDDFFGADGKYKTSTKTKTNNIYIMTVVNNKQVPVLLSQYKFQTSKHGSGLKESNQIMANIIGHYVNDQNQEYGVATDDLPGTKMYFSPSRNAIFANFFPPESLHSNLPSHRLAPVGLCGGRLTWRLSITMLIIHFTKNQYRQVPYNWSQGKHPVYHKYKTLPNYVHTLRVCLKDSICLCMD
jgi:hypothetical protein